MHMPPLTRRTQILLDERQYTALERRASASGRSVASLIREAIDEKLGHADDAARRRAAIRSFLDAPAPGHAREPDWSEVKDDLRDRG